MVTSVDDILEELNLTGLKSKREENEKENMSPKEKIIFSIIEKEPVHIDKICEIAKMPASQALSIVSILEIRGIIKNIGGKFVRIK